MGFIHCAIIGVMGILAGTVFGGIAGADVAAHADVADTDAKAVDRAFNRRLVKKCWLSEGSSPADRETPCFLAGDFDGDGKVDRAVLVVEAKAKARRGIAVLFADGRAAQLGAGSILDKSSGRDFSWLDVWKVVPHAAALASWGAGVPLAGDAIFLARTESASALVGWVGGRFVWKQQAD